MSLSMQNPMMQKRFSPPPRFAGAIKPERSWAQKAMVAGNYIDQASVVKKYGAPVNYLMLLAAAGVTGYHTLQAQPEEKKKVLIRDALVLSATVGGTIFASGGLLAFKQLLNPKLTEETVNGFKGLIKQGMKPLQDEGENLLERMSKSLPKLKEAEEKISKTLLDKLEGIHTAKKDQEHFTKEELHKIYELIKEHEPKKVNDIFGKIFGEDGGLWDEIVEAKDFFVIGALGVLSGIGGGLLANKINGVKDPEKVPNMVKEGIFQFVANIGMCAVGAGSALALMNPAGWAPESLKKPAEKITYAFHKAPGNKLYRFGGVLAGLSVGILGGSHIANYVGQHYVNPMLDKIQGKESRPPEEQGKRHIEGMDMVLHVDDIPTAAAIAGTAILGPWIMPFFPVSGYKAGIGYRNDEKAKKSKEDGAGKTPQAGQSEAATNHLAKSSGLVPLGNSPQMAFGQPFTPQYGGFSRQTNAFNSGQFAARQLFQGAQRRQAFQ